MTDAAQVDDRLYYYLLKQEARSRTVEAINRKIRELPNGDIMRWNRLTLCSIRNKKVGDALAFAEQEWPKFYGPSTHPGFAEGWDKLVTRYEHGPDHFDLAVWQRVNDTDVLVALALGNPSRARRHLTLKWVERFFGESPLAGRALWPILGCLEEYARLLGCERILIKDPLDQTKYARYGYAAYQHPYVSHGGCYMSKEVSHV